MSFDVNHLAVVEEAIKDGGGDYRITEQFLPVAKTFVGGNDGRASFVAMRDELEEEISLLSSDREIADLINDHQAGTEIGPVAHGNRLVRTRMLGGVGAGGEIPPATRLKYFFIQYQEI